MQGALRWEWDQESRYRSDVTDCKGQSAPELPPFTKWQLARLSELWMLLSSSREPRPRPQRRLLSCQPRNNNGQPKLKLLDMSTS
eukprot:3221132-Amphidinium_carterae.1